MAWKRRPCRGCGEELSEKEDEENRIKCDKCRTLTALRRRKSFLRMEEAFQIIIDRGLRDGEKLVKLTHVFNGCDLIYSGGFYANYAEVLQAMSRNNGVIPDDFVIRTDKDHGTRFKTRKILERGTGKIYIVWTNKETGEESKYPLW